jgi:pimeloyl-ACP methyl ester carboxylesterase
MNSLTPLLLLPGLMNDERVWWPIRHAVAGRTLVNANTHFADSIPAIADAAIAGMPVGRFAVAGFSLGGYVALEICRQASDRVAGIALIDTGARQDTPESMQNRQRMIDALKAGSANFEQVGRMFATRILHPKRRSDPTLLALLSDMARSVGTDGLLRQQIAAMHRNDTREVLGRLRCPALVLCGREDLITPPALSEEMAELLAGEIDLVLVPECGHMSTLEQPAAVAEAFERWIGTVDTRERNGDIKSPLAATVPYPR